MQLLASRPTGEPQSEKKQAYSYVEQVAYDSKDDAYHAESLTNIGRQELSHYTG